MSSMDISGWLVVFLAHFVSYEEFYAFTHMNGYEHMRRMQLPDVKYIMTFAPSIDRAIVLHMLEHKYNAGTSTYQIIADMFDAPSSPITQEFIVQLPFEGNIWFFTKTGHAFDDRITSLLSRINTPDGRIVFNLVFWWRNIPLPETDAHFVHELGRLLRSFCYTNVRPTRELNIKLATTLLSTRFH